MKQKKTSNRDRAYRRLSVFIIIVTTMFTLSSCSTMGMGVSTLLGYPATATPPVQTPSTGTGN